MTAQTAQRIAGARHTRRMPSATSVKGTMAVPVAGAFRPAMPTSAARPAATRTRQVHFRAAPLPAEASTSCSCSSRRAGGRARDPPAPSPRGPAVPIATLSIRRAVPASRTCCPSANDTTTSTGTIASRTGEPPAQSHDARAFPGRVHVRPFVALLDPAAHGRCRAREPLDP